MASNQGSAPPKRSLLSTALRIAIALIVIATGLAWAIDHARPNLNPEQRASIDRFQLQAYQRLAAAMAALKTE